MKTVHEVSNLTGVSVRTLHHYDAIGLLKPSQTTAAGYRLYDDTALARLQTILLFRELQFPLKEIKEILESPDFDRKKALEQQIELLCLQCKRLGELIASAREMIKTGEDTMNFSAFDKTEINQYAAEAKQKWGKTDVYKEYEQRAAEKSIAEQNANHDGLMQIFAELGKIKQCAPESDEAQALIMRLQQFITDSYYTCTPQILRGLAEMYTGDARMKAGIDAAGGIGTAVFAAEAIFVYCGGKN